jgi:hypothetical protein
MNEERLEQLLLEALDLFEQGKSVENILLDYPGEREALRLYLATAAQLSQWTGTAHATPTPQAQVRSKRAFLAAAATLGASTRRSKSKAIPWMRRLLAPILAVLLIAFLAGATLVTAADSALPGDTLYGTKLFLEEFRLSQTTNPEALQEQFRQERIREAERLMEARRSADVTIVGEIQSHSTSRWVIGGLIVNLTEATAVEGRPLAGREAQIVAHTEGGRLIADRIIVRADGPDDLEVATPVLPTPTSVPATATSRPSPTVTLTPTPLAPTATPLPPVSDDNANGNDDNGNDNGNNNDDDNDNNNGSDNVNDNNDDVNVNDNGNDNSIVNDNVNDNDDEANVNDSNSGSEDDNANDNDDGSNRGSGGDNNENDNDNDSGNSNDGGDD